MLYGFLNSIKNYATFVLNFFTPARYRYRNLDPYISESNGRNVKNIYRGVS